MADRSAIEWTDATWNPIRGTIGRWSCVKVSPGCEHCYAERLNQRFGGPAYKVGADKPQLSVKALEQPLHWKAPRKIFVCSMTDLFGEWVPDEWIDRIVDIMWATPQHTYQVLTKRAQRMYRYWWRQQSVAIKGDTRRLPDNLWLGVTAESQQYANERLPRLLGLPAAVRFVSIEPLLGPVDLTCVETNHWRLDAITGIRVSDDGREWGSPTFGPLHWVITGGESGGPVDRMLVKKMRNGQDLSYWELRPDRVDWLRSIRDQCQVAGVAYFHKQNGGPTPQSGGALLDRQLYREFPT